MLREMDMEDEPDLSEVCFVGGDLTEFNAKKIGRDIRRLDLSYNVISKLRGIEMCADVLEELILDNNQLEHVEFISIFPKLHTLSFNKNKIRNLRRLLEDLKTQTPNLKYLSLLGNPTCPDQLSDDYVDETDYQIYRYHVLHHVKSLHFLDHRQVSEKERKEATKELYRNFRTKSVDVTPLPAMRNKFSAVGKSRQGKRRFKYLGKNSEGNRFIKDNDL